MTRDNMLDEGEFVVAMHLIQNRLCGLPIPDSLSTNTRPKSRPLLVIAQANEHEMAAYSTIFDWMRKEEGDVLSSKSLTWFIFILNPCVRIFILSF